MVVENHVLAAANQSQSEENRSKMDIHALAQYIQRFVVDPSKLPSPEELINFCQDIVECLSRTYAPHDANDQFYKDLVIVKDFYTTLPYNLGQSFRINLIAAVLEKLQDVTSNPESEAAPATSIMLSVFKGSPLQIMLCSARWMVKQSAGAELRASLRCFYHWAIDPRTPEYLSDWIRCFINALEDNDSFDILIEVTVDNIECMFLKLLKPSVLTKSFAVLLFRVMASLRANYEALDKIAAHVGPVLDILATESAWSRQLLENVVCILTASIDLLSASQKDKYHNVILFLKQHVASRGCPYLQLLPWGHQREHRPDNALPISSPAPTKKVGLLNLGNTCYMNSVMQALLATRQFSRHVVLHKDSTPYWQKVGILFAKMMHSVASSLNPDEIFTSIKPPLFTMGIQHDSSEFLGYLFVLLHTYEHVSAKNFDYSRPLLPGPGCDLIQPPIVPRVQFLDYENNNKGCSCRSMSTQPGTSPAAESSGCEPSDAGGPSDEATLPEKHSLLSETQYVRPNDNSFIDDLFAGVVLNRLECTECHGTSLSRDRFRDIQLSFPEEPEPGKQHSVQSLLEYYCSKEWLSGENRYYCEGCGGKKDAEKSVVIESPPKYLILVLKHFKFEVKQLRLTKLMHSVHYNHSISLPTVRPQTPAATYTIYAAVIHNGTTPDSGHYYTMARDNEQWYTYNDEVVTMSQETELNQLTNCSTPYILFYRRSDIEELTMPTMPEMPAQLQEMVQAQDKHYIDKVSKLRCAHPSRIPRLISEKPYYGFAPKE